MADGGEEVAGERAGLLRTAAYLVIVIAGLRAAGTLLMPILVAALLALVFLRPVQFLGRRGVPGGLAIGIVIVAATVLWIGASIGLGVAVSEFSSSLGRYESKLTAFTDQLIASLPAGQDVRTQLKGALDLHALFGLVGQAASQLLDLLSSLAVILLAMILMVLEAYGLPAKLRRALGAPDADLVAFTEACDKIYDYLFLKTAVSLLTGMIVAGFTAAVGLDFWLFWGALAFLLNFVPNIGSVIAALPAVLLALVDRGWTYAAVVAGGYVIVNLVIGNLLEPRLMGRRLGLSTLVVFLSLLFWSWVWGPVGMLLSIPLTMVVKIGLEQSDDYRFVAVLLGGADPADAAADGPCDKGVTW